MPTSFKVVRDFARALSGDYGPDSAGQPDYSDTVLNQHINLAISLFDDPGIESQEVPEVPPEPGIPGTPADYEFNTLLTRRQIAILALRSVRSLIAPESNNFSYKTPVHSVSRSGGGIAPLRAFIEESLSQLEGRKLVCATHTDLEAILGYPAQFLKDLQHATEIADG